MVFDSFGMVSYPCQLPPFMGVTPFPSTGRAGSVRLTMMSTCPCPCTYAVGQEVGAQVTARPCLEPQQCCLFYHVLSICSMCASIFFFTLTTICSLLWLGCWTNMEWLECHIFSVSLSLSLSHSLFLCFLLKCMFYRTSFAVKGHSVP